MRFLPYFTMTLSVAHALSKSSVPKQGAFWQARTDVWRPTVNDVELISWGKPAKQKGTGSRGVPHRLNADERRSFDQARRKGFLEVAGSGWRSQRREAPLLNTHRSLCDAQAQACIVLHKGNTGIDELVVDISTLRYPETFEQVAEVCLHAQMGGEVIFQASGTTLEEEDDEFQLEITEKEKSSWETRPIYQLPPYYITWELLPRAEAKNLGKKLAEMFETAKENKAPSEKPFGVKPGKSRRHGGYGIGG
jgi:hypothetical protein